MKKILFNIGTPEIYKGYKILVVKITNEFPIFRVEMTDSRIWYNGYIVIPKTSKFYGKHSNSINKEIKVHGGFTFSDFIEGEYAIGFDTGHSYDNETTQNVNFVLKELKKAVDQIIEKERVCNE